MALMEIRNKLSKAKSENQLWFSLVYFAQCLFLPLYFSIIILL